MIIRMSVGDNDYTNTIRDFCEVLAETSETYPTDRKLPDISDIEDEDDLIGTVREAWRNFVNSLVPGCCQFYAEEEIAAARPFLLEDLEIGIVSSVGDSNENGEAVYYFPVQGQWIVK